MSVLSLAEILENCPTNEVIGNNFVKAYSILQNRGFEKVVCSVSGGSDSDIMVDIVSKIRDDIDYVWFDTGVEFQATKDHLDYLENRYGIKIERIKAIKPIPVSVKEYGQPFMSKYVSDMIYRLQSHNFKWENKPFEMLLEEYPNCKGALRWWCNEHNPTMCINRKKYLKEFMVENPPQFKISDKCCYFAKKNPAHKYFKKMECDLNIIGVRQAEGGIRATAYKSCFDDNTDISYYRPLFWYKDSDKRCYENHYGIVHSKCYTEYGMNRTGCTGCPYARDIDFELSVLERHEPKLYVAATNMFKDSYEYTKEYWKFRHKMETTKQFYQFSLFDYLE